MNDLGRQLPLEAKTGGIIGVRHRVSGTQPAQEHLRARTFKPALGVVPEKITGRRGQCKQEECNFHFQAVAAGLIHATGFDAGQSFCSCAAAEADRQTRVKPANTLATKNCAGFLMLNSQTRLRKR